MTLIIIKRTSYGYKVETATKQLPTDRQLKLADRYIKKQEQQPCNLKVAS